MLTNLFKRDARRSRLESRRSEWIFRNVSTWVEFSFHMNNINCLFWEQLPPPKPHPTSKWVIAHKFHSESYDPLNITDVTSLRKLHSNHFINKQNSWQNCHKEVSRWRTGLESSLSQDRSHSGYQSNLLCVHTHTFPTSGLAWRPYNHHPLNQTSAKKKKAIWSNYVA